MVQQFIYKNNELPPELKCQILSFLRVQWPNGFIGKNRLRNWIGSEDFHPTHFVLVEENNLLISFLAVVWKHLEHNGENYKAYGLSGVFTYPQFRNEGHGLQLVREAKKYIELQDADIVIFTSEHIGFYEKAGFIRLNNTHLLKGNPNNPEVDPESVFMLFLSDKGEKGRADFESKSVYFGEDTW